VPGGFSRSARTEKQRVFALADERGSGQIEDQAAIHLGIEGEVEVVERPVGIAEAGLFAAALQQPVPTACEFVRDQARDQIDGSHGFGLGLAQTSFEHLGRCRPGAVAGAHVRVR
jgi:hypothetical protein